LLYLIILYLWKNSRNFPERCNGNFPEKYEIFRTNFLPHITKTLFAIFSDMFPSVFWVICINFFCIILQISKNVSAATSSWWFGNLQATQSTSFSGLCKKILHDSDFVQYFLWHLILIITFPQSTLPLVRWDICVKCVHHIYKCRNIITTVVSVVVLVMLWATAIFANLQHYHPSKLTLRLVQDLHITCFCTRLVLPRHIINNRFVIIIIIMQLDFESLYSQTGSF